MSIRLTTTRACCARLTLMSDTWIIRPTRSDELSIVLHHRRQMYVDMGTRDVSMLDEIEEASRGIFGEGLRNGNYRGWFAEVGGQVIAGGGVLLLSFQPGPREPRPMRPFIVNVYTEPAYRRRGLARQLMQVMVAWCRAEGYAGVTLHASAEGRPLYESMGFEPTNEMRLRLR
jgi:GNAT superfamily N-acetyltransferase